MPRVGAPAISPDGTWVVVSVLEPAYDDKQQASDLWIVAADGRSLARALRVVGKVEPVFVEDIAAMPQTILDVARAGDVVLTMGAGSIGAVPGKLVEMQ